MTEKIKHLPSNSKITKEEEARQLLLNNQRVKQEQFLGEYRALCKKFGMTLEPQIQMVIKQ